MSESLPNPLVPAEVDLSDFQYMELDVQKLRDSKFAAEVDAEAFRAGVLLWCAAWHQVPAGSLPNNDKELSGLAGFGRVVKEWLKYREEALSLFTLCNDGRLYHRVVAEKAMAAWTSKLRHYFDRANDRLRKANKARELSKLPPIPALTFDQWNSARIAGAVPMDKAEAHSVIPPESKPTSAGIPPANALKGNGEGEGEGTERRGNGKGDFQVTAAAPPPPAFATPTPAPAPTAADAPATKGRRIDLDWQLPRTWGEWALAKYPHWTEAIVRDLALGFHNHWKGKTGKDATKLDWYATWQNWCMSDIAQRQHPAPKAPVTSAAQVSESVEKALRVAKIMGFDLKPAADYIDMERAPS